MPAEACEDHRTHISTCHLSPANTKSNLSFTTSQVTHVSAYADTATCPGDRLPPPLGSPAAGAHARQ
jgi:hypothetical protein